MTSESFPAKCINMKKTSALTLLMLLLLTGPPTSPANPAECKENEYLDSRGGCTPCRECGPGQELSKECGYGEGRNAQCTPCQPRRFKDSRSHRGCKPCLSCSLINRVQKANCTAVSDATCGECFPGFYRKTQIGGLQDQECIPCTKQTPSSEPQCECLRALLPVTGHDAGHSRFSPGKVESPPALVQDTALVVVASSALVVIVLVLLTVSILCCQRFWKSQCQRVFLRSQNFSGQRVLFQASAVPAGFPCQEPLANPCCLGIKSFSPCHRPREGPVEAVQFVAEAPGILLPCQQPALGLSKLALASPTAPPGRALVETQPLLRDSRCSDCSAAGSSLAELRRDSGRGADGPAPLSSCATERQHRWPHVPVECTELDLQRFSSQAAFVGTPSDEAAGSRAAQGALRGRLELASEAPACPLHPTAQARLALESPQASCPSFRNPTAESGEQLGDELQSLMNEIGSIAQGFSVASLPGSLVQSLACQLDPPSPGLRNVSHLGLELGVPPHQLSQISGFQELVAFLTDSGSPPLPLFVLARALQKLQRADALLLLREHCLGNQAQNGQH
ncbi:tumor necrosis factor receptor superfamily member 27 isoform X2 [Hemicordylus capensis]|uniref:tumor necrosis factor receptor superfamily member 27 isoform X2 n=1 Tax=Hemicordylus capensis TaxID=884348 RepID=UPI002304AC7F|nr:tumor necrosis factor receptor superfamily member 27 isoform X2 [Hemicordylus capensis]